MISMTRDETRHDRPTKIRVRYDLAGRSGNAAMIPYSGAPASPLQPPTQQYQGGGWGTVNPEEDKMPTVTQSSRLWDWGDDVFLKNLKTTVEAACVSPFATGSGDRVKVDVMFRKGDKAFKVEPGNFAQIRCYYDQVKSGPAGIYCKGINVWGDAYDERSHGLKTQRNQIDTIAGVEQQNQFMVNMKLMRACTNVLFRKRGNKTLLGKKEYVPDFVYPYDNWWITPFETWK